MLLTLGRYFLVIVLNVLLSTLSWADTSPIAVSYLSNSGYQGSQGTPVLFNMVPNSTQQLKFIVTSTTGDTRIIGCSITSSSLDTVGSMGGCTNPNGAGTPYPLVFTITAGNTPGNVTHTLTIQTISGRQKINIPINYTITSNSQRTITFQNYCNFDVYFGVATGTLPPLSGSTCSSNTNCPAGTECNGGQCFWIPPTPNNIPSDKTQTYLLAKYPGSGTPTSNSITIPDCSSNNPSPPAACLATSTNVNTSPKLWSGGFGGRTNCTFTGGKISCTTGDCGDDSTGMGGCSLGAGFGAPVTQVEPTFLVKTPDSYDVTIINGFNVPMSFTPSVTTGSSNPYDCGVPGNQSSTNYTDVLYSTTTPSPSGTLGGCSWSFSPPSNNSYYNWVSSTPGGPCSSCLATCGLTSANVTSNTPQLTCGKLLGYWTQDEICAANRNFVSASIVDCTSKSSITNCDSTTSGKTCPVTVNGQYTFYNLLACTSSPPDTTDNKLTFASCFAEKGTVSSSNCCGCSNWQSTTGFSGQIPTDPSFVAQCGTGNTTAPNSNWVNNVLGNLIWLKNACPSVYTYPYDDKTNGFACPYQYEGGQSAVNYTVTFCPGQEQGGIT